MDEETNNKASLLERPFHIVEDNFTNGWHLWCDQTPLYPCKSTDHNEAQIEADRLNDEHQWIKIAALCAENERLREVLRFYARETNWRTTTKYMSGRSGQTSVEIDSGSRARQALGDTK